MRLTAIIGAGATAATLALTGCGSTGTPANAPTVAQVARQLGASNVEPMTPTMYASHEGTAVWQGGQVIDIATFSSNTLRDKWCQAASEFGPIVKKGNDFAVTNG
jgi:hypothetical protein